MGVTRNVKQRTEEWHAKRKTAKVTGSTIYTAIGLAGVKKQGDYFDELLCGFPKHTSDKVNAFMAYGTEKEPSAMLTLLGKVMPVMFPDTLCCEEGFIELGKDKNNNPFMVVSPDGSVRCNTSIESTIMAIELKCPVYEIHKTLPTRYFLQCQAEIAALKVDSLVYLCWRPDFSSVFIVKNQTELFSRAYKLSENLYNNDAPKRARSLSPELKSLKKDIEHSCVHECTFVGIFPSIEHKNETFIQFYTETFTVRRTELLLAAIHRLFKLKFELLREKATEVVVFLCSTIERCNTSKCLTASVCWFTKGYSLDCSTMRTIAEHVMNECKKAGIHIPAVSFDGQWHVLSVRDDNDKPLTVLQLQKDVWREVEKKKKLDILKELKDLNKNPQWDVLKNNRSEIIGYNLTSRSSASLPKISQRVTKQRLSEQQKKTNNNSDNTTHPEKNSDIECEIESTDRSQIGGVEDVVQQQPDGTHEENGIMNIETNAEIIESIQRESELDCEENTKKVIDSQDASVILNMLKTDKNSNNKSKWTNCTEEHVQNICKSTIELSRLRDVDLKVIVRYLKKKGIPEMKESESKYLKLKKLYQAFQCIVRHFENI
ncbi:hypothetical protein DPMN_060156 [Dreissena polymorpha]|uniref:YqaJ viral recombinase domain-containing protein n=1 Tax=Dreissena polymorpha TaxID=45954 RepID=A0A9D4C533_DREPO|nr:hypothetical protein DPMN_060156 [Dreissena polymorpha]